MARVVEVEEDARALQRDVDKMMELVRKWEMELKVAKCKVMLVGKMRSINIGWESGVFQKKNKLGCFKRLIGHRCHLGSNRHGWGPLLPGCSILSAQHQYMGSFPQFFAWKFFFLSEPPL